jgi:hypothetical protein
VVQETKKPASHLKKEHPSLTVSLTYPRALPRSGARALHCGRGAAAPGFPGSGCGRPSPGRRHQARPSLLDARRYEGQQVRSHKEICFLEFPVVRYTRC